MLPDEADRTGGVRSLGGWRILGYLTVCLAVVDVAVAAGARRWRAYDPVVYRDRLRHCRGHAWDLVIIGGSPAMCGIDADALAGLRRGGRRLERVYNLALPLGTTGEVYLAVRDGLTCPPQLLVYGITASDLNESRVEPQGPRYLMGSGDVLHWVRRRPAHSWWCLRHCLQGNLPRLWQLFYYREGIQNWLADAVDRRYPGLCDEAASAAQEKRGFSQRLREPAGLVARPPVGPAARLDCLKAARAPLPAFPFLDRYCLGDYVQRLYRLLDWGGSHGVEIVLVDMPVPADLDQVLHPREFEIYRTALAEVEHARGVRVLRATRHEVGLTDAHFADLIHLNGDGTARLTAWLRLQLEGT